MAADFLCGQENRKALRRLGSHFERAAEVTHCLTQRPYAASPLARLDQVFAGAFRSRREERVVRELFDATICLGASWIWQGHAGTLAALRDRTRPGGLILVGEPYFHHDPTPEYLAAEEIQADDFSTHRGNVEIGVDLGLVPYYATTSTLNEWDRYETTQWQAAERWAAEHPDDPDREELLALQHKARDTYLRWGRDTLGWALYLFARPADAGDTQPGS